MGGFEKNYRTVVVVNERYKMMDYELPNEKLWSPNI
jgi:hypothetical protein